MGCGRILAAGFVLGALGAPLAAAAGSRAVMFVPAEPLRKALPFILSALLIYTLLKKDLGLIHAPRHSRLRLGRSGRARSTRP